MCEPSSETSQQLCASRTLSSAIQSSQTSNLSVLHSDLEDQLKRRNVRHQSQLRNVATKRCLNLFFKYNARSISELYDQCTSFEWADLLTVADINLHKHLNIALEMYIKECLCLQRADRWLWFIKQGINYEEEVQELRNIFKVQNINLTNFANHIYSILRCIDPKINCLKLWGTANSCKTLLAQLLIEPFIASYVNNHNSENEFYLSSFLNKSICICEELMITPATAEDFKSILGGQKLDISKKYTSKQVLIRTPIIVTSNHSNFGRGHLNPVDEQALNLRCYTYQFNTTYRPKCKITTPALAYLIFDACTMTNKNTFLYLLCHFAFCHHEESS